MFIKYSCFASPKDQTGLGEVFISLVLISVDRIIFFDKFAHGLNFMLMQTKLQPIEAMKLCPTILLNYFSWSEVNF